jgi:hypothetical protein
MRGNVSAQTKAYITQLEAEKRRLVGVVKALLRLRASWDDAQWRDVLAEQLWQMLDDEAVKEAVKR